MEQSNFEYYRLVLIILVLDERRFPFTWWELTKAFALIYPIRHRQTFSRPNLIRTLEWIYEFRSSLSSVALVLQQHMRVAAN
jgi:hypothetical protein